LVADGIEFDLREAGGGEFRGELGLKLGVLEAGRFLGGDLDEGLLAEVTDTDDAKAVTTDSLLGLFDGGEAVGGDGEAGGESGGEAGGGGFFGDLESGLFGEGTDIGLGEAGVAERGGHGELSGGGATGPDFAGVVKVFPVGEDGDPAELSEFFHPLKKFRAAEVAAVGGIGGVGGIFELQGFQHLDRQAVLLGKG
jgi:hypothetical protein